METFFVLQEPSVCQQREQSSGGVKSEFNEPPALTLEQGVKALLSLLLQLQKFLGIVCVLKLSLVFLISHRIY